MREEQNDKKNESRLLADLLLKLFI